MGYNTNPYLPWLHLPSRCYMAFKTRTFSVDYSESKWIFISSHELLVCAVIILPLMHILPDESRVFSYLLQAGHSK